MESSLLLVENKSLETLLAERIQHFEVYKKNKDIKFGNGPFSYAYVQRKRYLVSNTPEQIAAFIIKHKMQPIIRIVNVYEELELIVLQGNIERCKNQEFLQKQLLPILLSIQMGAAEVPTFKPYTEEKYIIKNVRNHTSEGKHYLSNLNHFKGIAPTRISEYFETEELLVKQYPNSISLLQAYDLAIERKLI